MPIKENFERDHSKDSLTKSFWVKSRRQAADLKRLVHLTIAGKDDKEISRSPDLNLNGQAGYMRYKAQREEILPTGFQYENWLESFIKGDKWLWDQVYVKHNTALYSYALSLTKYNIQASEDLTAIAFSKLWHFRGRIQDESHIRPWLYRVLKNAFLDDMDKGRRTQAFLDSLNYEKFVEEDTSAGLEMIHAEIIADLMDEVRQLPPRIKSVFELFYFEHKDNKEIADILGIKEEAVARYKLRAKELLKSKFLKKTL